MPILSPPVAYDQATADMRDHWAEALAEMGVDANDCTPDELSLLIQMMEEFADTGVSPTASRMVEADYFRPPPSIEEFCEDDFWLGGTLRRDDTIDQKGLFPRWREEMYKVFQPGRQVNQVIITGAIGLGKTMVASIMMLYRLAKLLCMRDPIRYYGLARISRLIMSCFSVTKDQVMGGAFLDMTMLMGTSPFFNEILPVGDRRFTDQVIRFPNQVQLKAGSRLHQALGGNVLCTLIDEINFRLEKDAAKAAKSLVNGLERRQESRFKQHMDTLMILISSAKDQVDFLTQHIEKNRNNPKVVIWDFPLWEIRGGVTIHYSGKRFLVDTGDNINPASIIPCGDWREKETAGLLDGEEKQLASLVASSPANRFIWVPEEHRESFQNDLEPSIRDIAGLATGRMAKFFSDHMRVINMIRDGIENPFVSHTLKLSVDSTHYVQDALADRGRRLVKSMGNAWVPRRHQHSPRYIHIDISTGIDALGLVCIHPIYLTEVKRLKLAEQESEVAMRPVYELDFALRIVREHANREIDFGKIRAFIQWLKDHGFNIRFVSCDLRHLSMEMRGILTKMGFNSPYLSVDIKRAPYDTFKQAVVEQRVHIHPHDVLCLEMVNLEDNTVKIDHPDNFNVLWRKSTFGFTKGSKDLADGLAGAIYLAETDKEHSNVPMFNPDEPRGKILQANGQPFVDEQPMPDYIPTF
jgi:hypothetical protein